MRSFRSFTPPAFVGLLRSGFDQLRNHPVPLHGLFLVERMLFSFFESLAAVLTFPFQLRIFL
jgi:hypothetical protein